MLRWFYKLADRVRRHARARAWNADRALGRAGEDIAHRCLQQAGLLVIARNWRTRGGWAEVDLIARDGETLVFVEVKSRASAEYGSPERAIDEQKRGRIARAAREYVRRADWDWRQVRFDVVTVVFEPTLEVAHIRDAFGLRHPH